MMDYDAIDKAMSKRVNDVFGNPTRHQFVSVWQSNEDENLRGPRGGKIRGKKRVCAYCGMPKAGHAEKTEDL